MDDRITIDGVSLALPAATPSTLEEAEGRMSVRRFFPGGPAVYAMSVVATGDDVVDAVQSAAGDVVQAYRSRPGYSRVSRPTVQAQGADESLLLDFEWDDSHGVSMHSLVLIAANTARTVILHGALPKLHGDEALATMETTIMSTELASGEVGA